MLAVGEVYLCDIFPHPNWTSRRLVDRLGYPVKLRRGDCFVVLEKQPVWSELLFRYKLGVISKYTFTPDEVSLLSKDWETIKRYCIRLW